MVSIISDSFSGIEIESSHELKYHRPCFFVSGHFAAVFGLHQSLFSVGEHYSFTKYCGGGFAQRKSGATDSLFALADYPDQVHAGVWCTGVFLLYLINARHYVRAFANGEYHVHWQSRLHVDLTGTVANRDSKIRSIIED